MRSTSSSSAWAPGSAPISPSGARGARRPPTRRARRLDAAPAAVEEQRDGPPRPAFELVGAHPPAEAERAFLRHRKHHREELLGGEAAVFHRQMPGPRLALEQGGDALDPLAGAR